MDPTLAAILATSIITMLVTVIRRIKKSSCFKPGHGMMDVELRSTPPSTPDTIV
jgi:hypothetical protein